MMSRGRFGARIFGGVVSVAGLFPAKNEVSAAVPAEGENDSVAEGDLAITELTLQPSASLKLPASSTLW